MVVHVSGHCMSQEGPTCKHSLILKRQMCSKVMTDRGTGRSRGFGFVSYETPEPVDAIMSMHKDRKCRWTECFSRIRIWKHREGGRLIVFRCSDVFNEPAK